MSAATSFETACFSMMTSTSGRSHARISIEPSKVDRLRSGDAPVAKRFSSRSTTLLKSALTMSMQPVAARTAASEPATAKVERIARGARKAMSGASGRLDDLSNVRVQRSDFRLQTFRIYQLPADVGLNHREHRVEDDEICDGVGREHAVAEKTKL